MDSIKLIEVRSDQGGTVSGSKFGPATLRNTLFKDHEYSILETRVRSSKEDSSAKNIAAIFDICQRTSFEVHRTLKSGSFPLILSGDHSTGLGFLAGVRAFYPNDKIALIWVDAHGDLHSPYTTPSGNLHGMPLAAILGFRKNWPLYGKNSPSPKTEAIWERLLSLSGDAPMLQPQDVILLGLRDFEVEEMTAIDRLGISHYSPERVRELGMASAIAELLGRLKGYDRVVVSLDVDALDAQEMQATGLPTPGGFLWTEVKTLLKPLLTDSRLAAFEISELNPLQSNDHRYIGELKEMTDYLGVQPKMISERELQF